MGVLEIDKAIPEELAGAEVLDKAEQPTKFDTFWSRGPVLVLFIRHFGCIGCTTQMVAIEPRIRELQELGIRIVVVGNGAPHFIEGFIEKFRLADRPVEIYTDPSLKVYNQAGLRRKWYTLLDPRTYIDYLKAFSNGIGQKGIQGDNHQQGGAVLISENGLVEFYHQNQSVADVSDTSDIMASVYKYHHKQNEDLI